MTQDREKAEVKKRGKHGFTHKRGYLPTAIVRKVNMHRKKMEVNSNKELEWHDALIDLLKSHPDLQNL